MTIRPCELSAILNNLNRIKICQMSQRKCCMMLIIKKKLKEDKTLNFLGKNGNSVVGNRPRPGVRTHSSVQECSICYQERQSDLRKPFF